MCKMHIPIDHVPVHVRDFLSKFPSSSSSQTSSFPPTYSIDFNLFINLFRSTSSCNPFILVTEQNHKPKHLKQYIPSPVSPPTQFTLLIADVKQHHLQTASLPRTFHQYLVAGDHVVNILPEVEGISSNRKLWLEHILRRRSRMKHGHWI